MLWRAAMDDSELIIDAHDIDMVPGGPLTSIIITK